MDKEEKVYGVVYALSSEILEFMFKNKKSVFIKYTSHVPTKRSKNKIKEGMQLYFYESGKSNCIIGEAVINSIEYLPAEEIIQKYSNKLIVTRTQFEEYSKDRLQKPALVIQMGKLQKYKIPIKLKFAVNMGGLLITNENCKPIFKNRIR